MTESQNYYKILKVREDASESLIKQAFRQLARGCHPDLHPNNPKAELEFKRLQEAYDVLGDRIQRRQYDRLRTLTGEQNATLQTGGMGSRPDPSSQIIDPQRMYSLGIQLAAERKYTLADQRFTQAIELKPEFLEAFMGRCQVRYVLGDDRGVLEDCTAIIRLKSQVPQAHYYQGRARHRLNFVDHAIQAYSQAISLDEKYASAYYYRGLARADQQQRKSAIADLKTASQLYRLSGNPKGALRADNQLRQLRRQALSSPLEKAQSFSAYLWEALINPLGANPPLYQALSDGQASQVGFAMAFTAIASVIISCVTFWPDVVSIPWYQLAFLSAIPFIIIALISNLSSWITQQQLGNWSGDIFVAGTVIMPLGIGSLLTGLHPILGTKFLWAIGIAITCLTVMIFYTGLTQISRFSEGQATWIIIISSLVNATLIEGIYGLLTSA